MISRTLSDRKLTMLPTKGSC